MIVKLETTHENDKSRLKTQLRDISLNTKILEEQMEKLKEEKSIEVNQTRVLRAEKEKLINKLSVSKYISLSLIVLVVAIVISAFYGKDNESIQPTLEKDNEPIQPTLKKDNESIQPTLEKDNESIQPTLEEDNESIQPTLEKDNESIQPTLEKDNEPIQPTLENENKSIQPTLEKDNEPIQPTLENDNKPIQPTLKKKNESSQPDFIPDDDEEWIEPVDPILDWYTLKTLTLANPQGVPPCVRVMTNFSEYKSTEEFWYSPPFYTAPGGYKLQLMVDISSYDFDKDEDSIDIALYLMKGDYDDGLRWPFNGSVIVRLLNWKEDKNHIDHTFNISAKSGDRVDKFSDRQLPLYAFDFLSHSKLQDEYVDNGTQYLMNDAMGFVIMEVIYTTGYDPSVIPVWFHHELSSLQYGILPVYRTIEQFSKHKENNDVLYTDPFYTSNGGYKVMLSVCPNGNGSSKGTHVSVYIHLMKGPNDDSLHFPVTGIFTVQLLKWRTNLNPLVRTIVFDDSTPKEYRITTRERWLTGRGNSEFISHNDLMESQYLHEDMISFKISFEPIIQTGSSHVPSWHPDMETGWQRKIASLIKTTPHPCYTGTLYSFTAYKNTNSIWYSRLFYLKDAGYELQMKIQPNGAVGRTKQQYLSLFLLLKFTHDDSAGNVDQSKLITITVEVLNWLSDENHKTVSFDVNRISHKEPCEQTYHSRLFISHTELYKTSDPTVKYMNDDNVCFRIRLK